MSGSPLHRDIKWTIKHNQSKLGYCKLCCSNHKKNSLQPFWRKYCRRWGQRCGWMKGQGRGRKLHLLGQPLSWGPNPMCKMGPIKRTHKKQDPALANSLRWVWFIANHLLTLQFYQSRSPAQMDTGLWRVWEQLINYGRYPSGASLPTHSAHCLLVHGVGLKRCLSLYTSEIWAPRIVCFWMGRSWHRIQTTAPLDSTSSGIWKFPYTLGKF